MRVPTTFADAEEIVALWSAFVGLWKSDEATLVLVPRRPRIAKLEPRGTLSGFIAEGSLEGVLIAEWPADRFEPVTGTLRALFYAANAELTPRHALLTLDIGAKRLLLTIDADATNPAKAVTFEYRGEPNIKELCTVPIIGHRGLGFAGLDNRPSAIEHSWLFGSSGIEMDIVVPFKEEGSLVDRRRVPLIDAMTVYHPLGRSETELLEDIDPRHHRIEPVLAKWREYGVRFLYLDAKFGWLDPETRQTAIEKLRALAYQVTRVGSDEIKPPHLSIAAVEEGSAKYLGNCEADDCLSWTLEWTEVEKPRKRLLECTTPPAGLSFDLNRISGSKKFPFLDPLMSNLTSEEEREIGHLRQMLVFWTANDADHFAGALNAATDPKRMGRAKERGEIAIMTDYPHRLASWVAHQPQS